jgi:hypothetical protein
VNAGQLAALIAAGFWALLVCAALYVLARLARLISAGTRLVTEYSGRTDELLTSAQAAVDQAAEQLDRTGAITASMDDVTANMAELSGHVSGLTGLARELSAGLGGPLSSIPAVIHGLRRAVALRRAAVVPGTAQQVALPGRGPSAPAGRANTAARGARP